MPAPARERLLAATARLRVIDPQRDGRVGVAGELGEPGRPLSPWLRIVEINE